VADFKKANPTLTDAQVAAVERVDRPDWGSPLLKNCFFCAGTCWNNTIDNISCQVSQKDPLGNNSRTKKRSTHIQAMEKGTLAEEHPEVHSAIEAGNEVLKRAMAKRDVENVLEECTAAQLNQITIIVPGFGRRYHCDKDCLTANQGTRAPTPSPTPHPMEVDPLATVDPNAPTFDTPATVYTGAPTQAPATAFTINTINNGGPGAQINGNLKACTKDNEVCGMSGQTKLFCKCKLCGYKQEKCPSGASTNAVSAVLAAVAAVVAVARLF